MPALLLACYRLPAMKATRFHLRPASYRADTAHIWMSIGKSATTFIQGPTPMTEQPGLEYIFDDDYVQALRAQMLQFAHLQLSDHGAAEDAVQEALASALNNAHAFAGASTFKTWVFAILKNKIIDHYRRSRKLVPASSLQAGDGEIDASDDLFDRSGHWQDQSRPQAWANPEGALESEHFWRVFDACLEHLPSRQAQVFMMREFIGLATPEICQHCELTVTNLNVLLHRARLRLRQCLENHWFARGDKP